MIRRSILLSSLIAGTAGAQDKVTYQDHVRPILENRCLNCHNAEKKKGGLDLTTFGGTMAGGSGGVNLEPGDPAGSQFFKCITHAAEPFMPPKSDKLPQTEIDVISKWIAGGLLETASSSAKVKKKADFAMAAGGNAGKPEGPPAMPEHLLLEPVVTPPRPDAVVAMAHSPWAPLVAIGSAKQVLLYHSVTRELLGVLPFPEGGFPECVTFTRNGALVLASGGTGGKKGLVAVWDVKSGKRVITLGEEFESIATADITPDYKKIAIGTREKRVKIYDTANGRKLSEIKKHTDWVTSVAFSPDGVLLATGDRNGGLYVWETATGGEFYNLKGHEKRIAALAWRADSNVVASGSEDGTWIWWEMQNGGQVKKQGSHGGVLTLNFAPDGRMVSGGRDGHVRIWDGNGNQKRDWMPGGGSMVLSTRFTEEGKTVVTGTAAGDIKIWNAEKDGDALGFVIYNPPAIDTRLDLAGKEIAAKQGEVEKAKAAVAEKEKLAADAKSDVEATRKAMAEAETAATTMAKEAETLKAEAAKMGQTKQEFAAGVEATKKQLAALTAPATPAPAPTAMPDPVKKAIQNAGESEQSLNTLSKAVLESKIKTLTETLAKLDSEAAARQKTAQQKEKDAAAQRIKKEELAKSMPEKEKKVQEMEKAVAAVKPMIDAATAAIAGPQRSLQFWQAAKENKNALTLKGELSTLKEKIEDLKAEIPSLEGEVKSLTAQKTATPAPKPADVPKIEKKIVAANKRLDEAKKELAAAEPQLPEKEKAVEATWQKYLSMLPK
ncbi:MAG TPA: c-type cytochrome domain-containing protein [Verrucomicrobiales bacterium]|nr:c-type cytochrome domain-containing protein [Verrucomicrobiales bacterium]